MPDIAGRSLTRWREGILSRRHYAALVQMARLSPSPIDFASRYFLAKGTYPAVVPVRTPLGVVKPTLYSFHDVQTVNEIFLREDYRATSESRVVVDFGSNIGISGLYFLTRSSAATCFLFEPVPRNLERLRVNLEGYGDRYRLSEVAVADQSGEVEFGVEPTGRYGGIGVETGETIRVPCLHVNNVLTEIIEQTGHIDVLKIDTEGAEGATVSAIRPDLLDRIRVIYFESATPQPFHADRFDFAFYNQTCRMTHRGPFETHAATAA